VSVLPLCDLWVGGNLVGLFDNCTFCAAMM